MYTSTLSTTSREYAPVSTRDAAAKTTDKQAGCSQPIISELETYQWQDTYFAGHQDIIAVFDHDSELIAKPRFHILYLVLFELGMMAWLVVFLSFMNHATYDVFDEHGRNKKWEFIWKLEVAIWLFLSAVVTVAFYARVSKIVPPHTAVTAQGVWHRNGGKYWGGGEESYLFPFNGIVDVTAPNLMLVNVLSTYQQQQQGQVSAADTNSPSFLALGSLKNPALFQKLVLALKNRSEATSSISVLRQDELSFASSMVEMVDRTASDGSSEQVLLAIHEELKRRNDILKSAFENASVV